MKAQGLRKAKDEVDDASIAAERMQMATNIHVARSEWKRFVEHFGRFFNKIEAASKGDVRSEQWFGRLSAQRKRDPLLSYLLHARNAHEHSIDDIAHVEPGHIHIGGPGERFEFHDLEIDSKSVRGTILGFPHVTVEHKKPTLVLLPVIDRSVSYQIPSSHLGQLVEPSPVLIASLAVQHGRRVLAEADQLFSKPSGRRR